MARLYGIDGIRQIFRLSLLQIFISAVALSLAVVSAFTHRYLAFAMLALAGGLFGLQRISWQVLEETLMRFNIAVAPERLQPRGRFGGPVIVGGLVIVTVVLLVFRASIAQASFAAMAVIVIGLGLGPLDVSCAVLALSRESMQRRERLVNIWESTLESTSLSPTTSERLKGFVGRERRGLQAIDPIAVYSRERTASNPPPAQSCGFSDIRGYHYPGLISKPVYQAEEFEFSKLILSQFERIKAEVLALYESDKDEFTLYPFENNPGWRSLPLYKGGVRVARYADRLPTLMDIVENHIAGATVREVVISHLASGAYIAPHFDNTLPMLTLHVPLIVPEGGAAGIRVGSEVVVWSEGRPVIIDTTYEHEAWNYADSPRLNLLLDFWHPGLSPEEREFFAASYQREMEKHLSPEQTNVAA